MEKRILSEALIVAWEYHITIKPDEWGDREFINHIVEFIREMLPPEALDEYQEFLTLAGQNIHSGGNKIMTEDELDEIRYGLTI